MRELVKKIIPFVPLFIRFFLFKVYELSGALRVKKFYKYKNNKKASKIKNILFYHPTALSFGGTEKFLQIIAKYIDHKKFNIHFMYGNDVLERLYYLFDKKINLIPFTYSEKEKTYPYSIKDMHPSFFEIVKEKDIDLIIIPGSGYTEFPINIVKDIPIIMLNIFGSPAVQKNIVKHICISNEVANRIRNIVPEEKIEIMYIPSEKPMETKLESTELRNKFGIKKDDIVFGRIGRASNEIFDPIGIRAFSEISRKYSNAHYLIMSAPSILKKIVEKENIKNVHFIEPSSNEKKVWAFHNAIDVLAHFRNDGESCGLNIGESMLCGNPIITHKSHIWNAHIEYLKPEFSRVAEKDNVKQYAKYMEEMIVLKNTEGFENMRKSAKKRGEEIFLIHNAIEKLEGLISKLNNKNKL